MRSYFNYFTEIEEYFAKKRGKALWVSPLDWCLIELWKQQRIPLHVVLRGIDRSFESAQRRGRQAPRTLFYCQPAVLEANEEYRLATLGQGDEEMVYPEGGGEGLSRDEVIRYLEGLVESLKTLQVKGTTRSIGQLKELVHEVSRGAQPDPRQLDLDLGRVGESVANQLFAGLDGENQKKLETEVAKAMKIYRKRVSPEIAAQLERNYLNRLVRERFGLPDFSLFEISR